jgi:AbrB family looped-hinge helix DNA binding protein
MRITSKGQVTIPQDIRERIGLLPDTEVEFEVVGNAVKIGMSPVRVDGNVILDIATEGRAVAGVEC